MSNNTREYHLQPLVSRHIVALLATKEGEKDFRALYAAALQGDYGKIAEGGQRDRLIRAGLVTRTGMLADFVRHTLTVGTREEGGKLIFEAAMFENRKPAALPEKMKNGATGDVETIWYVVGQIEDMMRQPGKSQEALATLRQIAQTGTPTRETIDESMRMKLITAGLMKSDATLANDVGNIVLSATEKDADGKLHFNSQPFVNDIPRMSWTNTRSVLRQLAVDESKGKS